MIGRTLWHFSSVESTQTAAFSLGQMDAPHGTVVSADFQRVGRGREGRSWEAPAGSSLMFSVLLRPSLVAPLPGTISILIANALAKVFRELVDSPVHIKWPNDVLIDGKKVSGILIQSRLGSSPVSVLGIGININLPLEHLPEGATCLNLHAAQPIDRQHLLDAILVSLNTMWQNLAPSLTPAQKAELNSNLWLMSQNVQILDGTREITGEVLGIAESGGLRLLQNGTERVILAGEITRGPRAVSEIQLS